MDKYKGHTPAPWEWLSDDWWGGFSGLVDSEDNDIFIVCTQNDGDTGAAWIEFENEADKQLLQDAPALLKENRILRIRLEDTASEIDNHLAGIASIDLNTTLRRLNATIDFMNNEKGEPSE